MEHQPDREVKGMGQHRPERPTGAVTDEELIAHFQKGNEAAFDELVARYKDPLTNFVMRFVGDPEGANDIVQDTFVRVFRNRSSYRPVAKFSTWIYTIATNLSKSHLRRKKLLRILTFTGGSDERNPILEVADESARADLLVDAGIKEERIQHALDRLSTKHREVIVLREIQELSYEEIAAVTGVNVGTVKSRINRARERLQEMLKDLREE